MKNDAKQERLHELFAKLRRIKTVELPRAEAMDPVERAMQKERIREAIKRIEEDIERCLNGRS